MVRLQDAQADDDGASSACALRFPQFEYAATACTGSLPPLMNGSYVKRYLLLQLLLSTSLESSS